MITITGTRTPATVSAALTNGMAAAALILATLLLSSGATHVVEAFTGSQHTHYNHHRSPGRRQPVVEGAAPFAVDLLAPGTQPQQQHRPNFSRNTQRLRMSDEADDDDENDEEDQNNEDDNFDDKNEKEMIMYVMGDDDSKVVSYDDATEAYDEADDDDDDDDDDVDDDPYTQVAHSEFSDADNADENTTPDDASSSITTTTSSSSATASTSALTTTTEINWSSALAQLSNRVDDIEKGVSQNPAQTLFRMMSSETPNQMIGTFVATANPTVVQAMSGAITSLLGGLSNPSLGIDTIVKAPRSKIGTLCFQLQMTGYMFRYVYIKCVPSQ